MRAWTIVLFVLAIHACLAMFTVTDITNSAGYNWTIDTSSKSGNIIIIPGTQNVSIPSSDPQFFDSTANGSNIKNSNLLSKGDFVGGFIESVVGVGTTLVKLMAMFGAAIFSIHTLCAPYFGDFNSWILEGMVDFIFAIGLFQMITGRSFKILE